MAEKKPKDVSPKTDEPAGQGGETPSPETTPPAPPPPGGPQPPADPKATEPSSDDPYDDLPDPREIVRRVVALEDAVAESRAAIIELQAATGAPTLPGVAGAGQREKAMPRRQILYHTSQIAGKVFTGEGEIEKALADGWKDNPAACKAPPKPE